MGTKTQLLDWARKQLGTVGGSKYWNDVKGWSGGGLPWCAIFCSDALKQTNTACNYFPNTVAFDRRDSAVIGSAWVDRYALQAGDMVSMDWDGDNGGDHVGIVESVLGYGVYQTIEGNVSNSVGRRTRYAANILGGIRPKYAGEKADKLAVDGVFGALTIRELQTRLKKSGCYSGGIDGDFGYYSRLALQQYLRGKGFYTTAYLLDGIFGYYSVLALQKYLRKLGYYTDAYLLDGDWGKYTTIALQKALNAGKF